MLLTQYYDSLAAMLDAVEETPRQMDYATMQTTYMPMGATGSTDSAARTFYGRPLAQMVADCRAMTPFTRTIQDIEAMAAELRIAMPPPRSVKRRRVHSANGDYPDTDRILAGDLEHAWITTRKLLHDDPTTLTTIILPTGYSGTTPQETIYWNAAATLALAWLLEQSGRRTCLVSLKYGTLTRVSPETEYSSVTILKAHDAPWSLQEAVVTTDRAYLRRLGFRLMECLPTPPDLGYSYVPNNTELAAHLAWCSQEYDWRHVITGAHPQHNTVRDRASALTWISKQLTLLEGIAAV